MGSARKRGLGGVGGAGRGSAGGVVGVEGSDRRLFHFVVGVELIGGRLVAAGGVFGAGVGVHVVTVTPRTAEGRGLDSPAKRALPGGYDGPVTATWRETQKANRRARLLESAAALFAERGFAAVTTVELGEAVGMSGPALYKHFASKDAILAELLVDASERLLEGCRSILATSSRPPVDRLAELIEFHIGFAVAAPDIIRIQDRELAGLPPQINQRVRTLQRTYVSEWDAVLAAARPELPAAERLTRLLATFGMLNSTPHSAASAGDAAAGILAAMAHRALLG